MTISDSLYNPAPGFAEKKVIVTGTLVSGNINFMVIFTGVLSRKEAENDSGSCVNPRAALACIWA